MIEKPGPRHSEILTPGARERPIRTMRVSNEEQVSDPDHELRGQVIDHRYLVEERIGRGGMGSVWRVKDLRSSQLFALKTIHGHLRSDSRALRRFLQEARVTGSIRSPHVVEIVEVAPNHNHCGVPFPFFVMELLIGQNVSEYLASRSSIHASELIWMMRQIVCGLSAADGLR